MAPAPALRFTLRRRKVEIAIGENFEVLEAKLSKVEDQDNQIEEVIEWIDESDGPKKPYTISIKTSILLQVIGLSLQVVAILIAILAFWIALKK